MIAALLLATTLTWSPSLDDALEQAQREKKLVLVYLRSGEDRDNVKPDANVARAAANENVAFLMQSFVLSKPDAPEALLSSERGPAFVVLDPRGLRVTTFAVGNEKEIAMNLGPLRDRAPELVRASELRVSGHKSVADVVLARELMLLGLTKRAIALFASAARELRREGDTGTAAYAELWEAVGQHNLGDRLRGRDGIDRIAHSDAPPAVVAEAWMFLGDIAMKGAPGTAIAFYRKAYEIAPLGSPVLIRARSALEGIDTSPLPPKGEQRTAALRLIAPARGSLTGRAQFVVEADPAVERVELFLDDVPVASDDEKPFRLSIDVGAAAVMRTVKAAGFDASGARVGEAVVTINHSASAFRVTIGAPAESVVRGPANIDVDVQAPSARKVDRVELFWNQTPIATLHKPPFRQSFDFPDEFGYVRAVAVLDDGTRTEDARIYNGGGASETVEVHAVTLLATVTGEHGKRVEGLTADDFIVEDEGTPVVANVQSAADLPVTIGIAIDSSSSMRSSMFEVLELATEFVRGGEGSSDRTFVAAFNQRPFLVHPISADSDSLRRAILSITSSGGTSIFDGVVFALQQFQNVSGRKALLVISDGIEGLSSESAAVAIRTARASAIPIYGLTPRGFRRGRAVLELSDATGGITFVAPRKGERDAVFARIRDDVRGQYVLTFESHPGKPGAWRGVRVRTRREGLKVRTVSGYYPR